MVDTQYQLDEFVTELNWDNPESLFSLTDPSQARKEQEARECGNIMGKFTGTTGTLRVFHRRCKHFDICPDCKAWKIKQEKDLLESLVGKGVKKVTVSKEEEDKLTRKYGKEKVRRIPIGENETAFIIDTEDEIGEPLTMDDCESLAKHAIPEAGRRMSGSLGSVSSSVQNLSEEDKKKIEEEEAAKDIYDPKVEIELWEMKVEFNSENEDAPLDWKALGILVQREVDIIENPDQSKEELQAAIKKLEDKTQEICLRYGMSFNFYKRTKEVLRLSEVDWRWVRVKQRKLLLA